MCGCLPFHHYSFPTDPELRNEWTKLVNRQRNDTDARKWLPSKDSKICSYHFVDFKPTAENPNPTLGLGYNPFKLPDSKRPKNRNASETATLDQVRNNRKVKKYEPGTVTIDQATATAPEGELIEGIEGNEPREDDVSEDWLQPLGPDDTIDSESGMNQPAQLEHHELDELTAAKKQIKLLKAKLELKTQILKKQRLELNAFKRPIHTRLLSTDSSCLFYTNIKTVAVFSILCNYIISHMTTQEKIRTAAGCRTFFTKAKRPPTKRPPAKFPNSKLPHNDAILMVLIKLRLGLMHADLAERFNISTKDVSNIFRIYITVMARALKPVLIVFYPRSQIIKTLPKEYVHYRKLRCIIDCSEIFIQKPQDLQLQAATWSDYKHHNTVKFLIGITPQGSIAYISKLWGGRTSDRLIVSSSGFLQHLHPGDQVLADRGFTVQEEILMAGAELVMPPAAKGKSQMTSADVNKTKKVANVRIHVERVIQKLKTFQILSKVVPISSLRTGGFDDVMTVCCAIINMQTSIVKHWDQTVL